MTIVPAVHILLQYVRWKSKIVLGKCRGDHWSPARRWIVDLRKNSRSGNTKYPFCLSCVVAWKLCDHAESYSPFSTSLRWWIRATTGRPYNVTGCKTTERDCYQTSRDQYLAKIIPRSYYPKSWGLWRTLAIYLRNPNSLVLRRIICGRIGVWASPEAFVIQIRNWR